MAAQTCSGATVCPDDSSNNPFENCVVADPPSGGAARTWPGGQIIYQFDPAMSADDRTHARQAMDDWQTATAQTIHFVDRATMSPPLPAVYAVVKGPPNSTASSLGYHCTDAGGLCTVGVSDFAMYHELGHLIGLPHEFNRYDRYKYIRMYKTSTLPACSPRCSVADDAFGPINYKSAMMYTPTHPDIARWDSSPMCGPTACGAVCASPASEPFFTRTCTTCVSESPGSGISRLDASKVIELYQFTPGWWDRYRRTNNFADSEAGTGTPYPRFIAGTNVVSVGSPAVETWESGSLGIYVRGSDQKIYQKLRTSATANWGGWTSVTSSLNANSDPAVVAWGNGRRDLVFRNAADNKIYIKSFLNGAWNTATSLSAPTAGAASSPAIASWGAGRLDVFVRGSDDKLYWRRCSATDSNCVAGSGNWNSWTQVSSSATFIGKPAAVGRANGIVDVFIHGMDHHVWTAEFNNNVWGAFSQVNVTGTLRSGTCEANIPAGDCFSPAVGARSAQSVDLIIRGQNDFGYIANWNVANNTWSGFFAMGGVMSASPALVTKVRSSVRIDLVAAMKEEREFNNFFDTIWWKQFPKP